MNPLATNLELIWKSRLSQDEPQQDRKTQETIVRWLLGRDLVSFAHLTSGELASIEQRLDYRYQILRKRYLEQQPSQAYCHLITRLGSLVLRSPHVRTWVMQNRERQKTVVGFIQEVVQDLLQQEPSLQKKIDWIDECTQDSGLREAFLLTSLEEYCLQPVQNQPLLLHRLCHFLKEKAAERIEAVRYCA